MSRYRPGQSLRLTEDGRRATIWAEAPGPGCYWAHLDGVQRPVLIRITDRKTAPLPIVTLVGEEG